MVRRRNAFTLIELLAVIGIILLLIGLLLPMIVKAMGQGVRTRIRSDLNGIAAGLDAYKQDFGDYPRIIYTDTTNSPFNGTGSGAAVLAKALLGGGAQDGSSSFNNGTVAFTAGVTYYPGQVVVNGSKQYSPLHAVTGVSPAYNDVAKNWSAVPIAPDPSDATAKVGGGFDGADGPGFRVRGGGYGQVYGPYLNVDKYKSVGFAIADYNGHAILYFPGNPAKPSVTTQLTGTNTPANLPTTGNALLSVPAGVTAGSAPSGAPKPSLSLYNYSDGDMPAMKSIDSNLPDGFPSIQAQEAVLGNYSLSGFIDTSKGENAATTGPYLLWSSGSDGVFGPVQATQSTNTFVSGSITAAQVKAAVGKCDDVTNFTFGQ